jgi:hypothetical protein
MEVEEKKKIEEHQKVVAEDKAKAEEEQKKAESSSNKFGTLPKYQDLFKSFSGGSNKLPPLPPLPPLPKFEPTKPAITNEKPTVEVKPVIEKPVVNDPKQPVFVNQPSEVKVPQPPQFAKKNQPVFDNGAKKENEEKPNDPTKSDQGPKLSYDDLFGNGIV